LKSLRNPRGFFGVDFGENRSAPENTGNRRSEKMSTTKAKSKSSTPIVRAEPERADPSKPLGPDQFVRLQDGYLYFGVRLTQIDQHIQTGSIPAPVTISDLTEKGKASRARGWFGSQILDWKAKRLAKQRPVRVRAHR
jgi:predicted DNA-binding transcriptional regulator AlpA